MPKKTEADVPMNDPALDVAAQLDELREAIRAGESLVLTLPQMKYGGQIYTKGDKVQLMGGPWDEKLLKQGTFVTRKRFEALAKHSAERKYRRDELDPAKQAANHALTNEARAEQEVLAAEVALRAAREKLEIAQSQRARAEREVAAAVEAAPKP